jgi:phosphatidylglycerol lysyltransferase
VNEKSTSEVPPIEDVSIWRRALGPVGAVLACVLILVILRQPSRRIGYAGMIAVLREMPLRLIWDSILLTVLSYLALIGRERCALAYAGIEMIPRLAQLLASLCGSALGNAVGFGTLSERGVRDRIYASADVQPEQITRLVLFTDVEWALALIAFAAVGLIFGASALARMLAIAPVALGVCGAVVLLTAAGSLVVIVRRREPLEIGQLSIAMPTASVALLEILTSFIDIVATAAALWILLSPAGINFFAFAVIFSVALALGVASRIPAGLGVFDAVILFALGKIASPDYVATALLVYRGVYFVMPLLIASASLAAFELRLPPAHPVATAGERVIAGADRLAPVFLSVITFSAGVMLIISGATPIVDWRLAALQTILPLWAVEISHLLATLAGVFLLFVARGLYRRLDGAWWLALSIALVNVGFSLTKGLAFGETAAMVFLVFLLLATRRQFTRPAAFLREPFTVKWFIAIAVVMTAAIGILLFAFRDVAYRREIWWQFEFDAQASRALRALLGASILALGISLWQLLRAAAGRVERSSSDQLLKAARIIQDQERSGAMLALMGDKSFLFSQSGNTFLMYAKRGRSWVALSDPVGPRQEWLELVWRFVELAAGHGGRAAFYQVRPENLSNYLDAGLRVVKVGEEACIYLKQFTLEGSQRYGLRQALKRAERAGLTFEIFSPSQPCTQQRALREISEAWLASHKTSERRFSVASFEPQFIAAQSVMLSLQHGMPLGFVTFMTTARHTEATVGLMRQIPSAPPFAMEATLTRLALELKTREFHTLSLGMAPLAGLVRTPLSSGWNRMASLLWEHGRSIYNFQGLRSFKNKFHPAWEPRYLAASGSIGPFITLADVAALASGHFKR